MRGRSLTFLAAPVAFLTAALAGLTGCGPTTPTLVGVDVVLQKSADCTQTGSSPASCTPAEELARQQVQGRWIFEVEPDNESITLTTHDGRSLTGLRFENNGSVIVTDGCAGEGGTCFFVRRRFESVDANDNNCRRFGELIAVGHLGPEDDTVFTGILSDINGNTEECGTASINQDAFTVSGVTVEQPVRALEEAAAAEGTP